MKITHGGITRETAEKSGVLQRMRSKAIATVKRSGTWRCGTWRRGPWRRGPWLCGTWRRGPWRCGTWRRGPWRCAFWAALSFTCYFSLYPHEAVDATFSKEVQAFDWLFHAVCYASLSALWLLSRRERPRGLLLRLDAALAFCAVGCALELAQALLPFVARTCTLSDASSNALGAILGAFLSPMNNGCPSKAKCRCD